MWARPDGLFARLRTSCGAAWFGYTRHRFVRELAAGTLPHAVFRSYLTQDYLFLVQFARAFALAVYKSDDLADMRAAVASLHAIIDLEMPLHVGYCAGWGLDEAAMAATPERLETIAYTRFVLDRGMAGDLLDLNVALAPCIIGYAEIAAERIGDGATMVAGNPYHAWLATYAAPEYQAVADATAARLDRLAERRGTAGRFDTLAATFAAATRLEAAFWQMGYGSGDAQS